MQVPEYKFQRLDLPNGVHAFFYPTDKVHSVAVSVELESGSLDEEKEDNGMLHFLEHLAFDGTEKMTTWQEVNEFHNSIAGSGNAYTDYQETMYYGVYPMQFLEKAIYYYSQIVLHPIHSDESIEKERTVILDEMQRYEDMVEEKLFTLVMNSRFQTSDTPFSRKIIGNKEIISSVTPDQVRRNFAKYYSPKKLRIYIAGNFDELECESLVKRYFYDEVDNSRFSAGVDRIFDVDFPDYSTSLVKADRKLDVEQCYLSLNFPGFEQKFTTQTDRILNQFANQMLSSSKYQNSILWSKLREELGLVYDVSSNNINFLSRGFNQIDTAFGIDKLEVVLNEIIDGVNKLLSGDAPRQVFLAIKKNIKDTALMRMDNISNIIRWLISEENEKDINGTSLTYSQYLEFIDSIEFQDVITTVQKSFDWDQMNLSIVYNEDPEAMVEKARSVLSKKNIRISPEETYGT